MATAQRRRRLAGAVTAPLVCLLAGAASAVVGAAQDRDGAALGALLATGVAVLFLAAGALPVLLVGADTSQAGVGFLVLVMTYLLRLVFVAGVLGLAEASGAVDMDWLVGTLIGVSLLWIVTRVTLFGRAAGPPVG